MIGDAPATANGTTVARQEGAIVSAEAMKAAWGSPYRGGTQLVLLAIADVVNDLHGNEFWMRQKVLAEKAHVSVSTVKEAVETLIADDWIKPDELDPEKRQLNGSSAHYHFARVAEEHLPPSRPASTQVAGEHLGVASGRLHNSNKLNSFNSNERAEIIKNQPIRYDAPDPETTARLLAKERDGDYNSDSLEIFEKDGQIFVKA